MKTEHNTNWDTQKKFWNSDMRWIFLKEGIFCIWLENGLVLNRSDFNFSIFGIFAYSVFYSFYLKKYRVSKKYCFFSSFKCTEKFKNRFLCFCWSQNNDILHSGKVIKFSFRNVMQNLLFKNRYVNFIKKKIKFKSKFKKNQKNV
jgi:hypothetical protein